MYKRTICLSWCNKLLYPFPGSSADGASRWPVILARRNATRRYNTRSGWARWTIAAAGEDDIQKSAASRIYARVVIISYGRASEGGAGRGSQREPEGCAMCNLTFSDLNVCLWLPRHIYNLHARGRSLSLGVPYACATHGQKTQQLPHRPEVNLPAWRADFLSFSSLSPSLSLPSILSIAPFFHRQGALYAWQCAGAIADANQKSIRNGSSVLVVFEWSARLSFG